ncbi:MAG: peptidylprolyl isomerase [Ignavibacteriales bacterium]|nr:peptidylprolyl isomerase [Ignavibacteriales bacterium]
MRNVLVFFGIIVICAAALGQGKIPVVIETEQGTIELSLDSARAPRSVVNFLKYVDGKFYSGGLFHRTVTMNNQPHDSVKIEVIQAGINPEREQDAYPAIEIERTSTTGILHKDGTVSMARLGPNSGTWHFFICVNDQPQLDFGGTRNPDGQGFAAFGQVVQGMDVVRKIQGSPAEGQRLTPPIRISSIRRK